MNPLVVPVLLMMGVCLISGFGGVVLKLAADNQSATAFALSLTIYSAASAVLYLYYRSVGHEFVLTTFTALLGTLICTQILSAFVLHEPVNWRALAVLFAASAAFAWAVHAPAQTSSHHPQAPSHGGSHEAN